MHKKNKSLKPKVGDLIACDDDDIGIVVKTSYLSEDDGLMISVKWSCGKVYTDPWASVVFDGEIHRPMFRILSAI